MSCGPQHHEQLQTLFCSALFSSSSWRSSGSISKAVLLKHLYASSSCDALAPRNSGWSICWHCCKPLLPIFWRHRAKSCRARFLMCSIISRGTEICLPLCKRLLHFRVWPDFALLCIEHACHWKTARHLTLISVMQLCLAMMWEQAVCFYGNNNTSQAVPCVRALWHRRSCIVEDTQLLVT